MNKTDEQINMEVSEAILNVMNKVQDEKQISFADYNNKESQELFAVQLDIFLRLGARRQPTSCFKGCLPRHNTSKRRQHEQGTH